MQLNQQEERKFSFVDTTATKKVFSLSKRIRGVAGGTSASKTISILVWLIDYSQSELSGTKVSSVISESHPHLEKGAILDFKNIMKDRGYWKQDRWNETKHIYTFETGNILEFYSVDTYGKAHGPRRDILFLNECNNLSFIIIDQLMVRTRKIVWMDWNPSEEFWFYTDILNKRDDVDFLKLTYLDNEALDEITVHEIESHKNNKQWWKVYGMGELGEIESRIYTGWDIIDEVPKDARLIRKGLDFGYTNDPTALEDIYEYDGGFIIDEQLYQTGMLNNEIAKKIGKGQPLTVADSSEPKSIAEIAIGGVSIIGAKKGKGSVSHGINAVKSRKISVTKRSINTIKEYRNYNYVVDDNGKITNEPEDVMNHAMDAIRYAIADLIPDAEEEDAYIQLDEYETPGLRSSKANQMPVSTIQPVNPQGTHKERMQRLLDRKNEESTSYESDQPWQPPSIKV